MCPSELKGYDAWKTRAPENPPSKDCTSCGEEFYPSEYTPSKLCEKMNVPVPGFDRTKFYPEDMCPKCNVHTVWTALNRDEQEAIKEIINEG